jgi:flagellar hook assembly protein FlgD
MLRFDLPEPSRVTLRVYDVAGQLVRTLVQADLPAGEHAAFWDGRTARGNAASSGVYLVRLNTNHKEMTQKVQLLK